MSTRYVYSIYNTTASQRAASLASLSATDYYPEISGQLCNGYVQKVAKNRNGEPVSYYLPSGAYTQLFNVNAGGAQYHVSKTFDYKYCVITCMAGTQDGEPIVSESYLLELSSASGAYWHSKYFQKHVDVWTSDSDYYGEDPDTASKKNFYISGGSISQGSLLLKTESSRYLKETGAFVEGTEMRWRALKGSDSIDPSAVTYSKQDLYPGEPVTISVTPVTPTYGGTVSYLYQYSIDGGSTWKNIGSKTTNTSVSITIPEGALQFQSRVTASDGWGFTSTTPVLGPSLGVSQLKAYAAVSGTSRAGVKMYATVGGKVKEIQKGYAIIGRKVHKIF